MRKGRTALTIALIAAFIGCIAAFVLTRPSVAFVNPGFPEEYMDKLPSSSIVSTAFRTIRIEESGIGKASPDLAVFHAAGGNPGYDGLSAVYGTDSIDGFDILFTLDETEMWKKALALGEKLGLAVLYQEDDAYAPGIADSLAEALPGIMLIPYQGRITDVNIGEIEERLDANRISIVLMVTPSTSMDIMKRSDLKFVVDFRDRAAISSRTSYFVAPLWDEAVKKALDGERGKIALDYALFRSDSGLKVR